MGDRTQTCAECGKTFRQTGLGRIAKRCISCRPTKSHTGPNVKCARCGELFTWPQRGRVPTACPDCRQRCTVDGCEKKPQRMTGLCAAHYRRWYKGADLDPPVRQYETGERLCKVDGCARPRDRSGTYCRGHFERFRKYGLTQAGFDELLGMQCGRCAVCGTDDPKMWVVDHDHSCCPGGKSCRKCVRGVLCGPCNSALGLLGDDPARAEAAAAYLRSYTRGERVTPRA